MFCLFLKPFCMYTCAQNAGLRTSNNSGPNVAVSALQNICLTPSGSKIIFSAISLTAFGSKIVFLAVAVAVAVAMTRGSLYCHCFCGDGEDFSGWPPLPSFPDNLIVDGEKLEEVLEVVDVPKGKMGRVIGRKGASILSIKESCRANIFFGGAKGPPDKVFVIGPLKEVLKAEAILRGRRL